MVLVVSDSVSAMSPQNSSPSRLLTVVDVYDLAAAIGKDFERIIEQYGSEGVRSLMPKVISALETLEALAATNERENEEIATLKRALERLEAEKVTRTEERHKFEMEMEHAEENYKKEIEELFSMVKTLQLENKQLSMSKNQTEETDLPSPLLALKDEDLKVLLNLKGISEQQRDQLKLLHNELADRSKELEIALAQTERLSRQNGELHRRCKAVQSQGRVLVEEKSELISQLQHNEEHIIRLTHRLGETERARKDLEQTKVEELQGANRDSEPRFTLAELREVLQEKNRLKARVMELEEERDLLKPQQRPSDTASPLPPTSDTDRSEDEVLVYGPINKEPEEKLFPWKYQRKESGVRKFFSWRTFGYSSSRSGTPSSSAAHHTVEETPATPTCSNSVSATPPSGRSYSFASSSSATTPAAGATRPCHHRRPSWADPRLNRTNTADTSLPSASLPSRSPLLLQYPSSLVWTPDDSESESSAAGDSVALNQGSSPCSEVAVEAALTPTTEPTTVGAFLARFNKTGNQCL